MDANLLYSLTIFCFVRGANEQKETDRHEANKYGSSILYTFIIIIIMHVRSASGLPLLFDSMYLDCAGLLMWPNDRVGVYMWSYVSLSSGSATGTGTI